VGHILSVICTERQLGEVTDKIEKVEKEVGELKHSRPDVNDEKEYAAWEKLFDAAREEKKQLRKKEEQLREEKNLKLKLDAANAEALKALSEGLLQFLSLLFHVLFFCTQKQNTC
jgi:chromosome segregation ATPase